MVRNYYIDPPYYPTYVSDSSTIFQKLRASRERIEPDKWKKFTTNNFIENKAFILGVLFRQCQQDYSSLVLMKHKKSMWPMKVGFDGKMEFSALFHDLAKK